MLGIFPGLNSVTKFNFNHKILQECYKNCETNDLVLQIVQFLQGHHEKLLITTDQSRFKF